MDKPSGWTSHDLVDVARKTFGIRKIGHTGTLDPLATGVLVLCLGRATKLSSFLTQHEKSYSAHIRLGIRTDTLDADGKILSKTEEIPLERGVVEGVVEGFAGSGMQVPPMYSARQVGGFRLHQLARRGEVVPRESRPIDIYEIVVAGFDPPWLDIEVVCSAGTYIRVLADDIGTRLGCGAHIAELRRTAVGPITLERCVTGEALQTEPSSRLIASMIDMNHALGHLPELRLSGDQTRRFLHGNPVEGLHFGGKGDPVRVLDAGDGLIGLGRWEAAEGVLKPLRVLRESADRVS